MSDESLDEYRLRQVEERTLDHGKRLRVLEQSVEVRDVKLVALKASADRNSALVGAMILAIVAAALGVFFGVGR